MTLNHLRKWLTSADWRILFETIEAIGSDGHAAKDHLAYKQSWSNEVYESAID